MIKKISHNLNMWTATLLIEDDRQGVLEVSLSNKVSVQFCVSGPRPVW